MNNRSKTMTKRIFVAIACFLLCFMLVFGVVACGSEGAQGEKGDTGAPGAAGTNGTNGITPNIGSNGNWWIGGVDTGVSATGPQGDKGTNGTNGKDGKDGVTPNIGSNGNWWIGTVDTGVKATGDGSGTVKPDPDPVYIAAPYSIGEGEAIDDEILEPKFYTNASVNGPTIGVTLLGVIKIGDKYFRDLNNNKQLDVFEDWRYDAATRATAMADSLTNSQLSYNLLNIMTNSPKSTAVSAVTTDGKPVWSKLMPQTVNDLNTQKFRNFVVRNNPATEVGVWFNNAYEQYSEWDAIEREETAVPFLSFTNPISHGMPSSPGITAAALGDGNADLVYKDAYMDGRVMWAKGIDGIYGPQIDLVTDPRWTRNSGTYGEVVWMAEEIARNLTMGYQNSDHGMTTGSTLLTLKHFPGDGASYNGFESHANTGRYRLYQTENSFANYQLKPFIAAIEAGLSGVMPCYSQPSDDIRNAPQSITYNGETHDILYGGYGSSFNEDVINTLLRDILGFDGLVNSDSISNGNAHGVNEFGDDLTPLEQTALFVKLNDSGVFAAGGAMGGMTIHPELVEEALEKDMITREELERGAIQRLKPRAQSGDLDNPYRDLEESVATVNELTPKVTALAEETHLKSVVLMKNTDKTLPLTDKSKKIYTRGFTNGATSVAIANFNTQLTAKGYTLETDYTKADIAYLRITPTMAGQSNNYLSVLDLGANFNSPTYDEYAKPTGGTRSVTTVGTMAEFQTIADAVHANGGKVVGEITVTNAWILTEMEPYCDALIGVYGTSESAISTVVTGGYKPTGRLSITMVADASVIAVEEVDFGNGEKWEVCVSPNDVPGYDKPRYMDPEVLKASPSGTYAYKDANNQFYWSGFGLTY